MASEEVPPRSDGQQGAGDAPPPSAMSAIIAHVKNNVPDTILWVTRVLVMFFTISYCIPIFGFTWYDSFYKALFASGLANGLRLKARAPAMTGWREFLSRLVMEDSAHYLMYSLMFYTCHPVTMVLMPVFLFALLHVQSFTRQTLNSVGPQFGQMLRRLMDKVTAQQQNMLRFIALFEIFMLPNSLVMLFTGTGYLLLPFMYYRFLSLRYASQRNPYTRQLFYELRVVVQQVSANPRCPAFVRNILLKGVSIVSNFAPPTTAPPPTSTQEQ